MIERYEGARGLEGLNALVDEVPGGVVSPGGAAAILRVSRQRVDLLIRTNPMIRAWSFHPRPDHRAAYVYVSVRDLVRYAVQRGTLTSPEDSNLSFPALAEEIRLARQAVDKATQALLY